jgi:peptide chain release factor 1
MSKLAQRSAHLDNFLTKVTDVKTCEQDLVDFTAMLAEARTSEDQEMVEDLEAELENGAVKLEGLEKALLADLLPPDQDDSRNVILELRAGLVSLFFVWVCTSCVWCFRGWG